MRRTLAALCAGILLAACSEGADVQPIGPDPDASGPDAADEAPDEPEPPTGGDDDPFAIPDEIDDAYVQAVLDELFALRTEALALAIEANGQRNLPDEAIRIVDAAHDLRARGIFGQDLNRVLDATNVDETFVDEADRGVERFPVEQTVLANDACIVAIGQYDRTGTVEGAEVDRYSAVSLGPTNDEDGINSTPWKLIDLASILDDGEPAPLEEIEGTPDEFWLDFVESLCDEGEP